MSDYRVVLTPDDNDTFLVTCPQLPGVVTFGETQEAALTHAVDAIETILASMIDEGETIPGPARSGKGTPVPLPVVTKLKLELYWALRAAGITRAELARRLGWQRESVDRLFRIGHQSRIEQLEAAFKALDQQIEVHVGKVA